MGAADIEQHQFTSEHQPAKNGRKKGVPNRATVYARLLKMKTKIKAPDGTDQTVTLYEAIALGQAKSAMKGNTNAWKEIQDSIHGKQTNKTEIISSAETTEKTLQAYNLWLERNPAADAADRADAAAIFARGGNLDIAAFAKKAGVDVVSEMVQ